MLCRTLKKLASVGYRACTGTTLLGRLVYAALVKCGGSLSLLIDDNFLLQGYLCFILEILSVLELLHSGTILERLFFLLITSFSS